MAGLRWHCALPSVCVWYTVRVHVACMPRKSKMQNVRSLQSGASASLFVLTCARARRIFRIKSLNSRHSTVLSKIQAFVWSRGRSCRSRKVPSLIFRNSVRLPGRILRCGGALDYAVQLARRKAHWASKTQERPRGARNAPGAPPPLHSLVT